MLISINKKYPIIFICSCGDFLCFSLHGFSLVPSWLLPRIDISSVYTIIFNVNILIFAWCSFRIHRFEPSSHLPASVSIQRIQKRLLVSRLLVHAFVNLTNFLGIPNSCHNSQKLQFTESYAALNLSYREYTSSFTSYHFSNTFIITNIRYWETSLSSKSFLVITYYIVFVYVFLNINFKVLFL